MYVAKKTWFFWHAAVRRMPSDREHAFFQGGKSTSYEHVCLVTANSGSTKQVNILRQSRRLYGCGPLKGAFSQPAMVQESAAAQTCSDARSNGEEHTPGNVKL